MIINMLRNSSQMIQRIRKNGVNAGVNTVMRDSKANPLYDRLNDLILRFRNNTTR